MTPSDVLYNKAKSLLGVNLAPGNEVLGCAISMSAVYNRAFTDREPVRFVNTSQWYDFMKSSPYFMEVSSPTPECITVAVTDMIPDDSPLTGERKHGHIWVVGKLTAEDGSLYMMSNNSDKGMWDTQWTVQKMTDYFITYGKVPVFYFQLV